MDRHRDGDVKASRPNEQHLTVQILHISKVVISNLLVGRGVTLNYPQRKPNIHLETNRV